MRQWIERQRYLIDYTASCLLRRGGRNAGLVLVFTLLVFVVASVVLLGHALRQEAVALLHEAPDLTVQRMIAGRHDTISADYLGGLRKVRGVTRVEGRLWGYHYDTGLSANYTLMVPPDRHLEPGSIAVGAALARARNADIGDYLFFLSYSGQLFKFRIDEMIEPAAELASADLVLVAEEEFRAFFGLPGGAFTDIGVWVRNPSEVTTVADKIVRAHPDVRVVGRDDLLRTYEAVFNWREGMVLVLLVGVILAFAIFVWDKASGLGADERREIGLLKAVGWETGDIIRMKAWEGLVVSLIAFLFGYGLAFAHVFFLDGVLFESALKGWSVLYPRFRLAPVVDPFQIVTLLFFTVFPYTLATVVPVWRVATIDPDTVMR